MSDYRNQDIADMTRSLIELRARIERIEQSLPTEEQREKAIAADKKWLKGQATERARLATLQQLAVELAARAGFSKELFESHFQEAFHWHLDRILRRSEDISPSLASQIDDRTPDSVPLSETPPEILRRTPPRADA